MSVHHDSYCYDDKLVKLRIGNEVFKVSAQRLTMASPIFRDMFELNTRTQQPTVDDEQQPRQARSGISLSQTQDQDGFVVLDDDGDAFKMFLWAIHAMPHQVHNFEHDDNHIVKCLELLDIIEISHKYLADEFTSWAESECLRRLSVADLDWPAMKKLLRVSHLSPDSGLAGAARDLAIDCMTQGKAMVDVVDMLQFCEPILVGRLRPVLGRAFYTILTHRNLCGDPRLREEDRQKLLYGHLELVERWHEIWHLHLRNALQDVSKVYLNGGYFTPYRIPRWLQSVLDLHPASLLERIQACIDTMAEAGVNTEGLRASQAQISENLLDFFQSPGWELQDTVSQSRGKDGANNLA